jgi:hypothetical protein
MIIDFLNGDLSSALAVITGSFKKVLNLVRLHSFLYL